MYKVWIVPKEKVFNSWLHSVKQLESVSNFMSFADHRGVLVPHPDSSDPQ